MMQILVVESNSSVSSSIRFVERKLQSKFRLLNLLDFHLDAGFGVYPTEMIAPLL